jgi:membrane protein
MPHSRPGPALTLAAIGLGLWRKAHPSPRPDLKPNARGDGEGRASARARAQEPGRGREAESPQDIPARGWKDIALRTWKEFRDDEIPMISAGVTFYTLLALFPGIGAFVALWGLFADVAEAQQDLQRLSGVLPGGAITLIGDQMRNVAAASEGGLSLAAIGGLLVSLWSANGAMKAIITGLNIAYDEKETRHFLRKLLTSLAFTLGFLGFLIVAAGALVSQPAIEAFAGRGPSLLFGLIAWPSIFVVFVIGLAVLYRYGPSRRPAKWRWLTWGSGFAGLVWLVASVAFSLYVGAFGSYDKTYGPLGAVVGFMTWTWISSMVILLGAELNSEMEHQTARDSTVGPPKPLGDRGAVMADTVGRAQ